MAGKVTFEEMGNKANFSLFHLHGRNKNRLKLESVLKAFKASCVMLEDRTVLEADEDGLTMDTFGAGTVHKVILIPEATTPPRMVYRVRESLGYAPVILEHEGKRVVEEIIIDTGCSLEILFTERFIELLDLKILHDKDIIVTGIGNSKLRAVLCDEVKVTCHLVKKGTDEVVLTKSRHLVPYVIIEDFSHGPNVTMIDAKDDAGEPEEPEEPEDMDIGAVIPIKHMVGEGAANLVAGSGMSLLGRKGLILLGLQVHLNKEYLYPTTLRSGFAL